MDPLAVKPAKAALLAALEDKRPNPFPIFFRSWTLTVLPWAGTIALLSRHKGSWGFWLLSALVAGFTQNALGVLQHEGSHFFFHRNRKANDIWCNLLVCLPIFNTVQGYRLPHAKHHRNSGEPDDPYFELYGRYPSHWHLIRGFLQDCAGLSAISRFFHRYKPTDEHSVKKEGWYVLPGFALVQAAIAGILFWATGKWFAYVLLWLAPLMCLAIAINRFRTIVEHYPGFLGIKANRTSLTGWLEYLCVAPYGYGNHLEHHLLPQIPYYQLDFAHRFLERHGVAFTENEVNTRGYLRTFARLVREMHAP